MKIDTMLAGLEDAPAHARRLEELGVDGAFTFEGPHDVFTPLILAAGATTTLELATNVAIAFPRNPVQLAHQAYDLQVLSKGRFTLGLGSQIRAQVEKRYGASFHRPIARMRELVAALRAIFAAWETGERLDFRGEFSSHTLMPPMFNPGPNPYGMPPLALGGLGPQMVRLAAEVADGVLIMPFNTARHFAERSRPPRTSPSPMAGTVAALVLRLHPGLPPRARSRRVGGPPARAQHALQVRTVGGDARAHRRHHARRPRRGGISQGGGPRHRRAVRWAGRPGRLLHALSDQRGDPGSDGRRAGLDRPDPDRSAAVSQPTGTGYDEFSLFEENANEAGLPYTGPPVVRREFVEVAEGRSLSALVWGTAVSYTHLRAHETVLDLVC